MYRPEGDYPINLFYSVGMGLEQDASWVGLGWNVNVGAITRNVRGIPDDYYNSEYRIDHKSQGHANIAEILDGAAFAGVITQKDYSTPLFSKFDVGAPNDIGFPTNFNSTNASKSRIYNQYGILHGKASSQSGYFNIMFDSYPLFDREEEYRCDY